MTTINVALSEAEAQFIKDAVAYLAVRRLPASAEYLALAEAILLKINLALGAKQ